MKTKFLFTVFLTVVLLNACGTSAPTSPTPDVNAIYTAAAQTVVAELTQTAAANTSTPETTATETETAQTATTVPTSDSFIETLVPTIIVEASPTVQICDDYAFITDVSVPDKTEMSPEQDFEKTWRIKNTGSCAWGQGYHLVFGYGDKMSGQARALPAIVSSGETVEVTVVFTAPLAVGEYKSFWRMANTAGANFGNFFSAEIVVR